MPTTLTVLVPVKMAVYRHLLDPPMTDTPRVPAITAETERQLLAEGLRVVNLFGPLASLATESAADHQYVFWRDDTDWNPLGISVAARAIAEAIGEERETARPVAGCRRLRADAQERLPVPALSSLMPGVAARGCSRRQTHRSGLAAAARWSTVTVRIHVHEKKPAMQ